MKRRRWAKARKVGRKVEMIFFFYVRKKVYLCTAKLNNVRHNVDKEE